MHPRRLRLPDTLAFTALGIAVSGGLACSSDAISSGRHDASAEGAASRDSAAEEPYDAPLDATVDVVGEPDAPEEEAQRDARDEEIRDVFTEPVGPCDGGGEGYVCGPTDAADGAVCKFQFVCLTKECPPGCETIAA